MLIPRCEAEAAVCPGECKANAWQTNVIRGRAQLPEPGSATEDPGAAGTALADMSGARPRVLTDEGRRTSSKAACFNGALWSMNKCVEFTVQNAITTPVINITKPAANIAIFKTCTNEG